MRDFLLLFGHAGLLGVRWGSMSKRKRLALIALVWAVAAILCALPSIWPWFHHLIGTAVYRDYELEANGILIGWLTRDVLYRWR